MINTAKPSPEAPPANRDLKALRLRVAALRKVPANKLDDAICDIIDLKGHALAVLLKLLPRLPERIQIRVAHRVEDFFFFAPNRGRRLLKRLGASVQNSAAACWPHLLAAIADIVGRSGSPCPLPENLSGAAMAVLRSDADPARKGKAVEILALARHESGIADIIGLMVSSQDNIGEFQNFSFLETGLFALKTLGGDSLLRLLVNPRSTEAQEAFRLEWRNHEPELTRNVLGIVQRLEDDFSQLVLKVVDLAEFTIPFYSMVMEGLDHPDKWVRQIATESFAKLKEHANLEHLLRMLSDEAPEVRLMAVNALGNFKGDLVQEKLMEVACNEKETLDMRMNALYSFHSQKNRSALDNLRGSPNPLVAVNAQGLNALLMPREEGLKELLSQLPEVPPSRMHDLFHYLMELARPDDLRAVIGVDAALKTAPQRKAFLPFLQMFMKNKAGPTLDKALAVLNEKDRRALEVLSRGFL